MFKLGPSRLCRDVLVLDAGFFGLKDLPVLVPSTTFRTFLAPCNLWLIGIIAMIATLKIVCPIFAADMDGPVPLKP